MKREKIWERLVSLLSVDSRSLRCIIISLVCHGSILGVFFFTMLLRSDDSKVGIVSITMASENSYENVQSDTPSKPSEVSAPKEETVDPLDSKQTTEIAQNLQKNTPGLISKRESIESGQNNDNTLYDKQVTANVESRSRYGKLQPRTFYGVFVHAKNMLFILDISGSMDIKEARLQLKNAYHSLSSEENFNIITFAEVVNCWQEKIMPATKENQQNADAWIQEILPGGYTNFYNGLKMGFDIACDVPHTEIYLVSDGKPTCGIVDLSQILKHVNKWNSGKKIRIHAIGIGFHQDQQFLKKLAAENGGNYFER